MSLVDGGWIDVSVPLRSGMVHWPDNPPVRIERMLDMDRGDVANVSEMSLGSHTGRIWTHPFTSCAMGRGWTGCRSAPPWDARG